MRRSVYPIAAVDRFSQTARGEKSSHAADIGYRVDLDTRTTSVGKRLLTATARVPDVEGWAFDHGHECDFAVFAGWCRSTATGCSAGGRRQRYLSGWCFAAARLTVRRRVG